MSPASSENARKRRRLWAVLLGICLSLLLLAFTGYFEMAAVAANLLTQPLRDFNPAETPYHTRPTLRRSPVPGSQ